MSTKLYSLTSHELHILFKYWDTLDPILLIDDGEVLDRIKQKVRDAILYSLKEGIQEDYQGSRKFRHVLRATEIKEKVEKKLNQSITRSNLYFHLEKLQKYGMVKIVKTFQKSRNHIAYFGRTAKIFIWSVRSELDADPSSPKSQFVKLTKLLNPDISEETIKNTFKQALNYSDEITQKQVDWIKKHIDKINEAGLQVSDIFSMLDELYALFKQPSHLSELIKLWHIKD